MIGDLGKQMKEAAKALDITMLVYGAGISDGGPHNHDDLPILLAGRGGGNDQVRAACVVSEPDADDEPVPEYAG